MDRAGAIDVRAEDVRAVGQLHLRHLRVVGARPIRSMCAMYSSSSAPRDELLLPCFPFSTSATSAASYLAASRLPAPGSRRGAVYSRLICFGLPVTVSRATYTRSSHRPGSFSRIVPATEWIVGIL